MFVSALSPLLVALASLGFVWIYRFLRHPKRTALRHLPGPKGLPFLGNCHQLTAGSSRYTFHQWAKQHGPIYKMNVLGKDFVVVSDFDHIYDVLVRKGSVMAGRADYFRVNFLFQNNGLSQINPDGSWRVQRSLGQRCLKQFGEGLARIEAINGRLIQDALETLAASGCQPLDPHDLIYDITLKSISTLIIGRQVTKQDPLFHILNDYGREALHALTVQPRFLLIDMFPFLVQWPLKGSRQLQHVIQLQREACRLIKARVSEDKAGESFAGYLMRSAESSLDVSNSRREGVTFTEEDAGLLCVAMVTSGHVTTHATFYAILNVLAHHSEIQERLWEEGAKLQIKEGDVIGLREKANLPLLQATILESLRYFTALPLGVPRRSTQDTDIMGHVIPKDTYMFINLWTLHHDPEFWGDPERFRPDRFLDAAGHVVPADHDTRKHLMPFTAGVRVCMGEQFALNRLLLWTANIVKQFRILPAEDNPTELVREDAFVEETLMRAKRYRVRFQTR